MKSSALRRRERQAVITRKSGDLVARALDDMERRIEADDLPTYAEVLAMRERAHEAWEARR